MTRMLLVRLCWNDSDIPCRLASRFHRIDVKPSDEFPAGRKGMCLARSWLQLAADDCQGMLVMDGDMACDPYDLAAMVQAIDARPDEVNIAPARLWPVSTKMKTGWVWNFGCNRTYSQVDDDDPDLVNRWTFCLSWMPRALLESAIEAGLEDWRYPGVDVRMCRLAEDLGLRVNVCWESRPCHMNY